MVNYVYYYCNITSALPSILERQFTQKTKLLKGSKTMDVWINELFMNLLLGILKILDSIMLLFKKLVGIEPVRVGEEDLTLTDYFLSNDVVSKVFWAIFIISLSICAVSIIVAVVKAVISAKNGEHKPHSKTLMQGVASIVVTIVMAFIMTGGIAMSNTILAKIDFAFKGDNDLPISATIMSICVENGYEQNLSIMNDIKAHQELMESEDKTMEEYPFIFIDDNGEEILYKSPIWDKENNVWLYSVFKLTETGYEDGKSATDFLKADGTFDTTLNATKIFGTYKKNFGFPDSNNPKRDGIIRMDSFNMVFAYFMSLTLVIVIVMSMLGLVKRLYDLVILFLSLPLVVSLLPLDDGAHFKIWRETVISKVVLAYGTIISVNVFMLLCPIILGLGGETFADILLKGLLLVGGALAINGGQLLFARLMGTSAEEFRDMTNSARALAAGAMGTLGAIKGGTNLLLGNKNAMGKRMGGLMPFAMGAARGAGNLAGNLLGGNAYRAGVNSISNKGAGAMNAIRGATGMYKRDAYGSKIIPPNNGQNALMENNGVIGAALKARNQDSPRMMDGSLSTLKNGGNGSTQNNTMYKIRGGSKKK